jgi:hypothetical protein
MESESKFYHTLLPYFNEPHHSVSNGCYQLKGEHEYRDFETVRAKIIANDVSAYG